MSEPYSLSAPHNSSHSHGHNIRSEQVIAHESWIKKNSDGSPRTDLYEVWVDKPLRQVYHDLFDESLAEYNSRQKRSDRKIKDYYDHIKTAKDKNLSYEFIFTIGNMTHHPDPEIAKQIYRDFVSSWPERNPNLILTGVYYHGDEDGAPHIHVDYIPVAYNCTRGLKTQNSQNQALRQLGFTGGHLAEQLFARERQSLKVICEGFGLDCTLDYMADKRDRLPTPEYKKMMQEVDAAREEILAQAQGQATGIIQDAKQHIENENVKFEKEIQSRAKALNGMSKAIAAIPPTAEIQPIKTRHNGNVEYSADDAQKIESIIHDVPAVKKMIPEIRQLNEYGEKQRADAIAANRRDAIAVTTERLSNQLKSLDRDNRELSDQVATYKSITGLSPEEAKELEQNATPAERKPIQDYLKNTLVQIRERLKLAQMRREREQKEHRQSRKRYHHDR